MKNFIVVVNFDGCIEFDIEAESKGEAMKKAKEAFDALPADEVEAAIEELYVVNCEENKYGI